MSEKERKLKWEKAHHPVWGKGGLEEYANNLTRYVLPKWQWRAKHKGITFSIVGPSNLLRMSNRMMVYEILCSSKEYYFIDSFKTLEQSQDFAEKFITNPTFHDQ